MAWLYKWTWQSSTYHKTGGMNLEIITNYEFILGLRKLFLERRMVHQQNSVCMMQQLQYESSPKSRNDLISAYVRHLGFEKREFVITNPRAHKRMKSWPLDIRSNADDKQHRSNADTDWWQWGCQRTGHRWDESDRDSFCANRRQEADSNKGRPVTADHIHHNDLWAPLLPKLISRQWCLLTKLVGS